MRRKWQKSVGISLAVVLALGALAVLLAPTLLSGVVRGRIERELASRLDATVRVGSVSLGWLSAQRVDGLEIDAIPAASAAGAPDPRESVRASIEVREGLWALLTGDEVHAVLEASVATSVGRDGSIGLAKLVRAADGSAQDGGSDPAASADGGAGALLGGRRVTVEFVRVALALEAPDARRIAVNDLSGRAFLAESGSGALLAELDATAKTQLEGPATAGSGGASASRSGFIAVKSELELPRRADGSFDLAAASASILVDADGVPLPSAAGEVLLEKFALSTELAAGGALRVSAKGGARVAGAEPASVEASVRIASLFDPSGSVSVEPSEIEAQADIRALPLAALQVFAPTVGEARIDLASDLGPSADLSLRKAARGAASVEFDSQRVRLRFDGVVSEDGSSIERGTLLASASVRPELVRAMTGAELSDPLAFTVEGREIAWRGGTQREAGLGALAGSLECALARPVTLRGALAAGPGRGPLDLSLSELKAGVEKSLGASDARVLVSGQGSLGTDAPFAIALSGGLDPRAGAVRDGAVDATLSLSPSIVASLTAALPEGALAVRGEVPTLRVKASAISLAAAPARGTGLGGAAWAQLAERLALRARVELAGAVECGLAGAPLALSGAAADLSIAAPGSSVAIDAGVRVDGATLRVTQQLPRLPASLEGLASIGAIAALGASGAVDLRSVDPALVRRLAPDSLDAVRALGAGPISVSVRNTAEARTMRLEISVDAQAVDAGAIARISDDAVSLGEIAVDGTLGAEALALVPKDAGVEIEPGASVSLRVETLLLSRTPMSSNPARASAAPGEVAPSGEWRPTGAVSARVSVPRLRVRSAPGFSQPLPDLGLSLVAGYAFATERATLAGEVAIGSDARDGRLALDLSWRKPVEAKLFAGVEGTVVLTGFDPARLDAALGSDRTGAGGLGARVSPSALLGGVGSFRVALEEKTEPRASLVVDFPRTRGSLSLAVREAESTRTASPEGRSARSASLEGSLSSTLPADAFEKLAGLDPASGRRVRTPVEIGVGRIRLVAPLDSTMKPMLADGSIEVDASLSDIVLEVEAQNAASDERSGTSDERSGTSDERSGAPGAPRGGTGATRAAAAPTRVASGPLRLELRSARLAESLRIRVQSGVAGSSGAGAQAGSLDADLAVRGLFAPAGSTQEAAGSTPAAGSALEIDGAVRATRYPAATIDALAATGGTIRRYLGDTIDAEVTATRFALSSLRADANSASGSGADSASPSRGAAGARGEPGQDPRAGGRNPGGRAQASEGGARTAPPRGASRPSGAAEVAGADAERGTLDAAQDAPPGTAGAASGAGHLSVRLSSEYAELLAPRIECDSGLVRVRKASPMTASLTMSPAVRDEILRAINIVFSDVETDQRARFTVQSLAYPLDGDLRRLNANFRLEVGDVRLASASWLAKALTIVKADGASGLDARIEPLDGRVVRGRLTYRDFALRIGRTRQDGWKHSVLFDGDVDVAARPIMVNGLTTSVPLADFGNWSRTVKDAFDRINAISPELAKSLKVGVRLSGPIADAAGAPRELEQELALPEIDDIIRNDPSLLLKLGPALIGQLRKAFE